MKYLLRILALFALIGFAPFSNAADQGTGAEAKALVQKAVTYLKENGKEKLLAEASNQRGKFVDRDLYLSIYDLNGIVVAHGANAKLIGKDASQMKDADDKFFIKEIIAKAKKDGSGWVDYKWVNPVSKDIQDKSTYFEKAGDLIIASGFYKK